jgi:alanine racemase
LRKAGIQLPILVMNAEDSAFSDCIDYNLEPALYSFEQLTAFVHQLIGMNRSGFPIHIKLDTGMHRLGFELKDLRRLTDILQTQPEIVVKGVYSHLSDADNRRDNRFTNLQISQFELAIKQIKLAINHDFISHILNSEGIAHYPKAQFDMVRIGIGMFGINQDSQFSKKLQPIVAWKSVVSQIKTIQAGASVGYNRSYVATNEIKIAIIPIGYGDGFKRNLSNGKGKVFIQGKACPTIGRVCMDMIMVDITKLQVHVGEEVELIGPHQSLEQMALAMGTIPYEVLTSFSPRVHRSYLNDE